MKSIKNYFNLLLAPIWLWWTLGLYIILRNLLNINYLENTAATSLFFLISTITILYLFKEDVFSFLKQNFKPAFYPLSFLLLSILFSLYFTLKIYSIFPLEEAFISLLDEKAFAFISLHPKFYISKITEIFFQQAVILITIINLLKLKLTNLKLICTFTIIFSTLHIPLIPMIGNITSYFFFSSIVASIVFPLLILNSKNGLIYSFLTHLFFYIVTGSLFRFLISKETILSILNL
jgi:hypothetical protein